ncbi:MAG: PDZ domain-containing protein [Chitinophagaceae bacterium]|nr:PDZ domain-containing protein [Chitinophagaceae bacterium]
MNTRFFSMVVIAIFSCFAASAQNSYRYSVDLTKPVKDELKIELLAPRITKPVILFYIPKIVPGTYTNSDFGKFVHNIKAFDKAGKALSVTAMPDSNSWQIKKANTLYRVEYTVEDTWDAAFKHGVYEMAGTNFEENKNFVLNTCGIFGYFEGMKKMPFELNFTKPAGFYGSSGLVPVNISATKDVFHCDNADHLYDSPIMFCIPDTTVLKVGVTDVLVSVYSPKKLITSKFVAQNLENLLNAAKNYLGGKLPVNKYAFLYYFNSEQPMVQGQGAWEHSYSSFYSLPELPQDRFISKVVDISSHEFFHIVTPLNICSKEVREFNFNTTILSKHLWLYEGSTEYDAHHTQVTQGLISSEEYLKRLSQEILVSRKYYNDTLSFTELSLGSADKHKEQYGNVYQKGALISACLDIYLEKLTEGNYGLHNLKHDLSLKYGPTNYFKDDELFDEITKLTLPEVRMFFAKYVEGNEALPYETFFGMAGVNYIPKREVTAFTIGGISIRPNEQGKASVAGVAKMNEFGKKMGYKTGDVLLSINGEEVNAVNFPTLAAKFTATAKEGDTLSVKVKRNEEELMLAAPVVKITKTEEYVLEFDAAADAEQLKIRNAWLNTQCGK